MLSCWGDCFISYQSCLSSGKTSRELWGIYFSLVDVVLIVSDSSKIVRPSICQTSLFRLCTPNLFRGCDNNSLAARQPIKRYERIPNDLHDVNAVYDHSAAEHFISVSLMALFVQHGNLFPRTHLYRCSAVQAPATTVAPLFRYRRVTTGLRPGMTTLHGL